MRMNPRFEKVQNAKRKLSALMFDLQVGDGITDIEALQLLATAQESILKYMLREERHPDEPNKKADEL